MIKTKHTPGPWKVDADCPTDVFAPKSANILYVVVQDTTVIDVNNKTGMLEREANARLIAAAPDLVAFAQSIEARVLLIREAFKSGGRAQLEQLILDMEADAFDLINKATGGAE